jgi:hypothetical protein
MNIFTHKGDGIVCPDFHVATIDGPMATVQLAIVLPRDGNRETVDARCFIPRTKAIAMAEAILKHFNQE